MKTLTKEKWKQQHPNFNQSDSLHKLNRPDQVILFRKITGHSKLNAHMHSKFKVGECEMCPCTQTTCLQNTYCSIVVTWCFEAGHVARTDTTEGQALWQPGGAEEDSCCHEGDRHLRLVYEEGEELHSSKTLSCESIDRGLVFANRHSVARTQKILTFMS